MVNLMMENQDDLAVLMTARAGQAARRSKGEIAYGLPSSSGSPRRQAHYGDTSRSISRISASSSSRSRSASSRHHAHDFRTR